MRVGVSGPSWSGAKETVNSRQLLDLAYAISDGHPGGVSLFQFV